jgi:hypothetical protein
VVREVGLDHFGIVLEIDGQDLPAHACATTF